MAIAFDEHGLFAGLVTVEDLVEEIVGEIGEQDRHPLPDVVRDPDGSLVLRGSLSLEKLLQLFDLKLRTGARRAIYDRRGSVESYCRARASGRRTRGLSGATLRDIGSEPAKSIESASSASRSGGAVDGKRVGCGVGSSKVKLAAVGYDGSLRVHPINVQR